MRELIATIRRAALFADNKRLTPADLQANVFEAVRRNSSERILNRPIENGINLPELLAEVRAHYVLRADQLTGGNATRAARILGIKNYQTFQNWIKAAH